MKKPKEIKVIFFLTFLFSGYCIFAGTFLKDDSLNVKLNRSPWLIKYGVNYLTQGSNFFYNDGHPSNSMSYNGSGIHAYDQHFLDGVGPYIALGKVHERSKHFSIYSGFYYSQTRFEFTYGRTALTKTDTPFYYNQKTYIAEGYILRHIIGAEINFNIDINRSRIIISPINPAFVFSSYIIQKKHTEEFNAIITYGSSGTHEIPISDTKIGNENFNVKYPGISLRMIFPVQIGFEQRIKLRKRVIVAGIKSTVQLKSLPFNYGGLLYSGFEF
ncbi:MAG: hypothetical protein H0U95_12670 [Bacteroidetes bacterium]|nr:hypothetical protein [Bacteroidota bacterium]